MHKIDSSRFQTTILAFAENGSGCARKMSALAPIADMCGATRYVRFVPIADIVRNLICLLLDYLIGIREQRRRDGEAERFRGLEIDY
jgi:hypothetical protein